MGLTTLDCVNLSGLATYRAAIASGDDARVQRELDTSSAWLQRALQGEAFLVLLGGIPIGAWETDGAAEAHRGEILAMDPEADLDVTTLCAFYDEFGL